MQTHIIWGLAAQGAQATEWSHTVSTTWATPASPFSHSPMRTLYLTTMAWGNSALSLLLLNLPPKLPHNLPQASPRDWYLGNTTIPSSP